jgi:thiamine-phosphate pyrophosphorylase
MAGSIRAAVTGRRLAVAGLYAITPDTRDDAWLYAQVQQALAGGARVLQYRDKGGDANSRHRRGQCLAQLCARHGTLFIVNDDVALARELGAGGVHVGRDDADVREARAALGPDAIVGVSCYDDLGRAARAVAGGADYLAFGSFFPSRVKPGAPRASLEVLREARARWDIALVAIGGITRDNAAPLLEAGADAIAIVTALFEARDTRCAAQDLCALFRSRLVAPTARSSA